MPNTNLDALDVIQSMDIPWIIRISSLPHAYLNDACTINHSTLPEIAAARHYDVYVASVHNPSIQGYLILDYR
jgi:hypothetical protein